MEGDWALEIETFLGPVKWHEALRRMPFGVQKSQLFWPQNGLPLAFVMDLTASKALYVGLYKDPQSTFERVSFLENFPALAGLVGPV